MKNIPTIIFFLSPLLLFAQPKIQLAHFASGFDLPVDIANCGDSRIFVVEREGVIWVLDSAGNRLDTFLNIDPRVNSGQNEQGLLGLAFDPNYATNGYFFVNYTKNGSGDTRVARFSVKPDNPNEADPNSELKIIEQAQPYWNHNGGCLRFGPDGHLYISLGDGGSGGDPQNYGQNKKTFLGKILRIDVRNSNASQPYGVPADNPFVGNPEYFPEIWSLGWRNPWRFSFDRLTGDMWIADVGQNLWEELDFEPANTPGRNYGWRCYEGLHNYNTNGCQPLSAYAGPFFEYAHSGANGCSVTGGFVYRGSKYPDLYGCYLFADYCSGRWWYTRRNADGTFATNILANLGGYEFSTFGEGHDGELYVALLSSGKVQRVGELCSPFQVSGVASPAVCADSLDGYISLEAMGATGSINYLWSNGATDQNLINLAAGVYSFEAKDGNNCVRRDTFEILNATPLPPLLDMNDTAVCIGNAVSFNLPAPPMGYEYQWYVNGDSVPAQPDNTFYPPFNSTYQVQLAGQPCNSGLSSPVSVNVLPVPNIAISVQGDTLTVSSDAPNAQIQWYYGSLNNPIPDAEGDVLIAGQTGLYIVGVWTPFGCGAYAETFLVVSETKLPANIQRFTLSPNPAKHRMLLEMEMKKAARVSISLADSSQRNIFSKTMNGPRIVLPIDLGSLPVGTYFLTVQTEDGSFVRQVLKK